MNLDEQMGNIWLKKPSLTLKAINQYSEERKQSPDLKDWRVRFNITRRLSKLFMEDGGKE